MENFVSVILKTKELDENAIVEAMLDSLDAPLAERVTDYGLFESENDTVVLRMPTPYALEESECEAFTQAFADKMFEMGYDDFDVEISLDEENVTPRPKGIAGNAWDRKHGKTHNPDGTPKKAPQPAPQAQTTAPKMGNSDTSSDKLPKVAGVQSNGKLTNFNIDKSLPSVDVKNIRTGENFRVYGPPANVEKMLARPEIEKIYSGRGDAGARQELELRKQQMKTGPDGAYDGDDLGTAPTAPKEIKVTANNYADMITRAKELAAKAKQAPSSGPSTRGKAGAKPNDATPSSGPSTRGKAGGRKDSASPEKTSPKANSSVNTRAPAPQTMMASVYDSIMREMAEHLYEELTDAEKKEYEAIRKGLEDLLASPDIDPPQKREIEKTLNDLDPDRGDPRKGDGSPDANQVTKGDLAGDPRDDDDEGDDIVDGGGITGDDDAETDSGEDPDATDPRGKNQIPKSAGPEIKKDGALAKFATSGKKGLANDPDEVDAIKELQQQLTALGFEVQADGKYGPNTIAAVKEFQQIMGLTVDGDAGPNTIAKLNEAKNIGNLKLIYAEISEMLELLEIANEGIVLDSLIYEAMSEEQAKRFDELYNKYKDTAIFKNPPPSLAASIKKITDYKAGAGANTPEEKEEAQTQQAVAQEKMELEAQAREIVATASRGKDGKKLNNHLMFTAMKYVKKREYALAMAIIEVGGVSVPSRIYERLLDLSINKIYNDLGLGDAPASATATPQGGSDASGDPSDTGSTGTDSSPNQTAADDAAGRSGDDDEGDDTVSTNSPPVDDEDGEEDTELTQAEKAQKLVKEFTGSSEADVKKFLNELEPLIDGLSIEELKPIREDLQAMAEKLGNSGLTISKSIIDDFVKKNIADAQADSVSSDGDGDGEGDGTSDGEGDGTSDGEGDGTSDGEGDGEGDGTSDGDGEGDGTSDGDGDGEGDGDGTGDGEGDGTGDGEGDGTGPNLDEDAIAAIAKELKDEFGMVEFNDDPEVIKSALGKIKTPEDWEAVKQSYAAQSRQRSLEEKLKSVVDNTRNDVTAETIKEPLEAAGVEDFSWLETSESISEARIGMFEETYDDDDEFYEMYGELGIPEDEIWEADYRGRKVKLNKPMRGDVKKFKVYVKNNNGNVIKVNFGDPNSKIKKSNPARRRSFRARHNCDNPGPKTKARYWSCRKW